MNRVTVDTVAAQLEVQLGRRLDVAATVRAEVMSALGDHGRPPEELNAEVSRDAKAVTAAAVPVAERLVAGDFDIARGVLAGLFGEQWPEEAGQGEWWRSSLGLAVARALSAAAADAGPMTLGQASSSLGISRGSISNMTARGQLAKHPEGAVSRLAVLSRLVARHL